MVRLGVSAQVAHGRSGRLDRQHVGALARERDGERAASRVQVRDEHAGKPVGGTLLQTLDDRADELLGLRSVHLEKRRRARAEAVAAQILLPKALPGKDLHLLHLARLARIGQHAHDARRLERAAEGLSHGCARERARNGPQRDLDVLGAHAAAHADAEDPQILRSRQEPQRAAQGLGRFLDEGHRDRAARRDDRLMRPLARETERERAVRRRRSGKLQLVAVADLALAGKAVPHQLVGARGVEMRGARQGGDHVVALGGKLRLVGQVLPRASSAHAAHLAERPRAQGRLLLDPHDAGAREGRLVLDDLDRDDVPGRGQLDEHRLPVIQAADRLGSVSHAFNADGLLHGFVDSRL